MVCWLVPWLIHDVLILCRCKLGLVRGAGWGHSRGLGGIGVGVGIVISDLKVQFRVDFFRRIWQLLLLVSLCLFMEGFYQNMLSTGWIELMKSWGTRLVGWKRGFPHRLWWRSSLQLSWEIEGFLAVHGDHRPSRLALEFLEEVKDLDLLAAGIEHVVDLDHGGGAANLRSVASMRPTSLRAFFDFWKSPCRSPTTTRWSGEEYVVCNGGDESSLWLEFEGKKRPLTEK